MFHDVPWAEPDLVEAYVAMGRGQLRFAAFRTLAARRSGLQERLSELENQRAGR